MTEYEILVKKQLTPGIRAYIRETERVCRANQKLLRDSNK